MHTVFISYSTKDTAQAETVRNVLESNAIPCWMAPRDIPGGSNYTKEIPSAIRGCQVFVLILSENSQNSHWVLKELDAAVNAGKVILPFMLEDCQLNDEFNFLLTGAQRYSAYQKKAEALEALIGRIRAITNGAAAPEAAEPVPETPPETAPAVKKQPHKAVEYLGTARCPACGGSELEELRGKIGRFTLAEKCTLLLPPVLGVVMSVVCGFLALLITALMPTFTDMMALMGLVVGLAGFIVGWMFGNVLSREWIRRSRVRKHVCVHPFRCMACRKEFLVDKSQNPV